MSWYQIKDWGCKALKKNTPLNSIAKIAFQASLYQIWLERNSRVHSQQFRPVEPIVDLIEKDVRNRVGIPKIRAACAAAGLASGMGI